VKLQIKQLMDQPTKRKRVLCAVALWALVLFGLYLLRIVYSTTGAGIPCPVFTLTGILCPGCGMFRATDALLTLHIWQAVRYNALAVILLPALLILIIHNTIKYVQMSPQKPTGRLELALCISIAVLCIIYAIARNLPFLDVLRPLSM